MMVAARALVESIKAEIRLTKRSCYSRHGFVGLAAPRGLGGLACGVFVVFFLPALQVLASWVAVALWVGKGGLGDRLFGLELTTIAPPSASFW